MCNGKYRGTFATTNGLISLAFLLIVPTCWLTGVELESGDDGIASKPCELTAPLHSHTVGDGTDSFVEFCYFMSYFMSQ